MATAAFIMTASQSLSHAPIYILHLLSDMLQYTVDTIYLDLHSSQLVILISFQTAVVSIKLYNDDMTRSLISTVVQIILNTVS